MDSEWVKIAVMTTWHVQMMGIYFCGPIERAVGGREAHQVRGLAFAIRRV